MLHGGLRGPAGAPAVSPTRVSRPGVAGPSASGAAAESGGPGCYEGMEAEAAPPTPVSTQTPAQSPGPSPNPASVPDPGSQAATPGPDPTPRPQTPTAPASDPRAAPTARQNGQARGASPR